MTPSLGIKPGPHWWEASSLTTVPSLHSLHPVRFILVQHRVSLKITILLRGFKLLTFPISCVHIFLVEPAEGIKEETGSSTVESELLEFSKFDINRVLKHGERLVGSSGAEYDLPDEDLTGIPKTSSS